MKQPSQSDPDVSVLIVTWNSEVCIGECLRTLYRSCRAVTMEVVAVDNASGDATVAVMRRDFPQVRVVETGANLGFARGVNIAMRFARGRFVFLLNPDTRFETDAIGELLRFLEANPVAGCAGPKLLELSGSVARFAAREFPSLAGTLFVQFGFGKLFPNHHLFASTSVARNGNGPRSVPCLTGAALIVRRSLLLELGPFNEQIPLYFEDLDLCARIHRSGRPLYYVPSAVITHTGAQSAKLSPARSVLFAMENGQAPWIYLKTYRGAWQARSFKLITFVGSLFRLTLLAPMLPFEGLLVERRAAAIRRVRAKALALFKWSLCSQTRFRRRWSGLFAEREVALDVVHE